jgi:hypothetical protein
MFIGTTFASRRRRWTRMATSCRMTSPLAPSGVRTESRNHLLWHAAEVDLAEEPVDAKLGVQVEDLLGDLHGARRRRTRRGGRRGW